MTGTPHSVLVVDDDAEVRQLLCTMLQFKGFHTVEAVDGVDALQKVSQQIPDAAILDVMMPQMDGITLCRKLRSRQETAHLPIIMLSGRTGADAVNAGMQAGANEYLGKPAGLDELLHSLHQAMQQQSGLSH